MGRPQWDSRFLWYGLALAGSLLLGAVIIWLVDRWRKRQLKGWQASGDQLSHFRKLYEQGDITAEEFARIRNKLTDQMLKEMEKPAPAAANPPQEPPTSDNRTN
jgi:hypothetical protein